jgi:hypothetical protein
MANTNKPSGFTPVKYLGGSDWDGRGNLYYIDQTDANAYFVGDMVKLVAGLDAASGLPGVTLGTASAALLGSVLACGQSPSATTSNRGGPYISPSDLSLTSIPATKTTNYFVLVSDDPNIIYEAQEIVVAAHAALDKTNLNSNINLRVAAPATGVKVSGQGLDNNTAATTATLPLKLLGLAQKYDNGAYNTFGAYAKWLCLINNHPFKGGTGTAGV